MIASTCVGVKRRGLRGGAVDPLIMVANTKYTVFV
jgi:hypothetical protein